MYEHMKIMIAYDGSPRAEAALRDLQHAGLPRLAEAKVISVVEPFITAGPPDAALGAPIMMVEQRETRQANWAVRQGASRLHKAFPDWACDTVVRQGYLARQIVAAAQEWKPELIVISPLNRRRFERWLFGSFSRSVVETAPCSVRVARSAAPDEEQGLRLLLGYDGSRGATTAVCEVALRRWPPNTEVHLVAVNPSSFLSNFTQVPDKREQMDELLEGAAGILCGAGLGVSLVQREGSPKQVLLAEAAQWRAHCIFLGRGERSSLNRFLLGRTSAAVAARAACTVEVVREHEPHHALALQAAQARPLKIATHTAH